VSPVAKTDEQPAAVPQIETVASPTATSAPPQVVENVGDPQIAPSVSPSPSAEEQSKEPTLLLVTEPPPDPKEEFPKPESPAKSEAKPTNPEPFAAPSHEANHPSPSRLKPAPQTPRSSFESPGQSPKITFSAIARHAGSCVSVFISAITELLFKDSLTLSPGESSWGSLPQEIAQLNRTRQELLSALVRLLSLGQLASQPRCVDLALPNFPFAKLILSMANISFRYLEHVRGGRTDLFMIPLLKSGFTLTAQLFDRPDFRSSFPEIRPLRLGRSFALSAKAVPTFEPFSPIANESVSFLYISLVLHPTFPQFLAKQQYSNSFVFYLISAAEMVFEKAGFAFIHTLLFSSVLRIVSDPTAAAILNAPYVGDLQSSFQPPQGSYVDLLLSTTVHICQSEFASTWAARIFHVIAPFISHVSVTTAVPVLELFERAVTAGSTAVSLFLEGFAEIVTRQQPPVNGFLVAIMQRARTFRGLEVPRGAARAVGVILAFLIVARGAARAEQKRLLTGDEAAQLFAGMDLRAAFPQIQAFTRSEPVLAEELPGWRDWVANLSHHGKIVTLECLQTP
jgi:hypothetical protein